MTQLLRGQGISFAGGEAPTSTREAANAASALKTLVRATGHLLHRDD